jgi:hypothetical protein
MEMQRNPPAVKKQIRREQGFVCAVPGCTNPYLWFHHFDPPWHVKHHNDPDGIIGLCGEHHAKADARAYETDQLREFKERATSEAPEVRGQFDWLRRDIGLFSGGILYRENHFDVLINDKPAVWFNRDDDGYASLNVKMPQASASKRVAIGSNCWISAGNALDIVSPPSGKSLEVTYRNGDHLSIRFSPPGGHPAAFRQHFGDANFTLVEVVMTVPAVGLSLHTEGIGNATISGSVVSNCHGGLAIRLPSRQHR